jgi:hypothetical protein
MVVFNPNILNASIHAITSSLREDQKAEVLLFAARFLSLKRYLCSLMFVYAPRLTTSYRSRHSIENAVESCLLIPELDARCAAKLRMLRVKARNESGVNQGVAQGVFPYRCLVATCGRLTCSAKMCVKLSNSILRTWKLDRCLPTHTDQRFTYVL